MVRDATIIKRVKELKFNSFNHPEHGALICISAEHGDDAADYYGEFRGGYPWINPKLEQVAAATGCYWEWLNPGAIALYRA